MRTVQEVESKREDGNTHFTAIKKMKALRIAA